MLLLVSDLLQNLNLTLQDVSLVGKVFHELLISAAKHKTQTRSKNPSVSTYHVKYKTF